VLSINSFFDSGFFRPKLRINIACKLFTSDLHSTIGHFEGKKSSPKYPILCPEMGSTYYFKKTSVLSHSAMYIQTFVWRACPKICADRYAPRGKNEKLRTTIPSCTKFIKVQKILSLILYIKFFTITDTRIFTAYRAKVPKMGKPFR
jgi:hypothetical protein